MQTEINNGVSAEFGYYPKIYNLTTERFSIQTLANFEENLELIKNDPNIQKDWIYPGPALQHDFITGKTQDLPYTARIFSLPKTHILTLFKSQNMDDLDFVVWCLSFFTGMRLTIEEAGFLDATPIKQGKLVDFVLTDCTLEDAINLALDYIEAERENFRATKRVIAAIHTFFLSQFPQNLPFERFQYLYMAIDTCFKIIATKSKPNKKLNHAERIQWMCEKFDIPTPSWSMTNDNKSDISIVRNDTIHEALFFDEPLGFSIYGGNQPTTNSVNVLLQMQHLVCRLLVAILGKPDTDYVKTNVESRMRQPLRLNVSLEE
ncbi:hypothetical protein I8T81_11950 [Acinetobacter seifertii]|uniref:hypothetical protein n=1 Tax=Acinetobacter seifertii TaxID=1530123 RepID=UPI0018DD06E9|nr:hypothetical protein [Acinetobacter seifertii]QPV58007.1 hypothetical protein I8T81_11950 [Acinetobacter seifertii]